MFDNRTRMAVIAFQKWEGLGRDGVVGSQTWVRLMGASRPTATQAGSGVWIEVSLAKQVFLYVQNGVVTRTLPTSTGRSYHLPLHSLHGAKEAHRRWTTISSPLPEPGLRPRHPRLPFRARLPGERRLRPAAEVGYGRLAGAGRDIPDDPRRHQGLHRLTRVV